MLSKIAFRGMNGSQNDADRSPRRTGFGVRLTLASVMVLTLPGAGTPVTASEAPKPVQVVVPVTTEKPKNTILPAVRSMDGFLKRHKVSEENRARLANALVASARKYDLNPRLLASIMIVESRGNQFAVSGKAAVGLMQIHLPTWGETVDRENINLFKIEDNIDFGARILKDYVRRFGIWEGVKRYNGFIPGDPIWEESAATYLAKVQEIYEFHPATT
jgi:soluble lytic murein transglycosylase-like protein